MLYYIILFFKGFLIGIGKIIPGVSGAVLAMSLGIYRESITAINDFFKNIKTHSKYLFSVGLGVFFAIILFSKVIIYFLDKFYLPTILFFLGLIIGTLPKYLKEIIPRKSKLNLILFVITFVLFLAFSIIYTNKKIIMNNDFKTMSIMFIAGFIEIFTMIIPGISGTAIMINIGVYDNVMGMISNLLNISYVLMHIYIYISYFLGIVFGGILTIKIVKYLFEKFENQFSYIIFALIMSSLFLLYLNTLSNSYTLITIIISLFLLFLGYNISYRLTKVKIIK